MRRGAMTDISKWLGRHANMKNEDYHAAPGISKSHLDDIADKSAMHYWEKHLNPNHVRMKSDAFVMGDAIHKAILEPDLFTTHFAAAPKVDRRTKEGKAEYARFEFENAGKAILSADQYQTCLAVRDAAHRHPVASGLLAKGDAEVSFFASDAETEELVKCRPDFIMAGGDMIIDVKTTDDASDWGFSKAITNYRYDLSPAWYFDVIEAAGFARPERWLWIAFEKEPPYAIGVYYAPDEMIFKARETARRDFQRILHYKQLNQWPDYGAEIRTAKLTPWAKR